MAKKRVRKKARKTAARRRPARARGRGSAKRYGQVRLTPPYSRPADGQQRALENGSHVVVTVAELSLGKLPERGGRSELQLDLLVRTSDAEGGAVASSWSSGIHYYVPNDARFHVAQAVVFDGRVHQHLSFDVEIVELEMPQTSPDDAALVAGAAAEAAVGLSEASGGIVPALGAFPGILGGILRLNGDDQVLRHATSLFTREVRDPGGTHHLVEGSYRLEKLPDGNGRPLVTLVLDVRVVRP